MKIELVLLGLIAVVLIVDFILRGIKKRKKSSFNEIEKPEESENKIVKKTSILRFILFLLSNVLHCFILTITLIFVLSLFIDKIDNNYLSSLLIELLTLESNSGFYSNSVVFNSSEYYIINLGIIIFIIIFPIITYISFKNLKTKLFERASEESRKQIKSNYIYNRKRNIVSFIILAHILKISIHYFVYPKIIRNNILSFRWHIKNIYLEEVWLFIMSLIILGVLVWLFNDKIKAR